jgi:Acyl-CoA synthetases (AMP-forming)/AMP-acid ligases II
MKATPTQNDLQLRLADFSSLAEALDYAAQGKTGFNFYRGGKIDAVLPYAKLREEARTLARRLCGLGVERGGRVGLVADTEPTFMIFFFACQYAGLVPVPLPAFFHMGSHKAYVEQLRRLLINCDAAIAVAHKGYFEFLNKAAEGLNLRFVGTPEAFTQLPEQSTFLRPLASDELAYLQYTSGSTRFPRGVMITQTTLMSNLADISTHGVKIRQKDRCVSWLPFYHDMGLVGLVLVPVASQRSVDYSSTFDFAMRPRQWIALMSQNQGTISFSPPFGYELCARRIRPEDVAGFDLSNWRVAGVGAEMIRPGPLEDFAGVFASCGFKEEAFLACYGMAECSLAVSFAPLDRALELDYVDGNRLARDRKAVAIDPAKKKDGTRVKSFVKCGIPLPQYEISVRDSQGRDLPDRHCGTLFVRGASVMSGYFADPEKTRAVLSSEGWLNTGDLAYRISGEIVITGRKKDLIIINGRNIWPQDLEYLAQAQPEVRSGDAAAFSVPGPDGGEKAVTMIECRESDAAKRTALIERLRTIFLEELGLDCLICLVPRKTLPRTTSGKLSRSQARRRFLEQFGKELLTQSNMDIYKQAI